MELVSPDGMFMLIIEEGTLVVPVPDWIIVRMAGTPPPPPGASIVAVYELLPSGITFNPPAQLVIKYDPEKVPEGSVLVIVYYDEAAGKWVELETAGYVVGGEVVPNTVASSVPYFTYFALPAKIPAE